MDSERAVYERYKNASEKREEALCCPTSYNPELLKIIPDEILEKDYGCGDPSQYVREGETVLDLGSGGGKLVYIIAQVVGRKGRVIGVDMNGDMLKLARKYEDEVAKRLGYKNFAFKRARIQNLRLDLERLDEYIRSHPIKTLDDYLDLEFTIRELEKEERLIDDNAIDVVVSNCVLNLVRDDEKRELFKEIFRVLKKGGRAVISDIVADKEVPQWMKEDPELWSGCISGAMKEEEFLNAFKSAGFQDVVMLKKDSQPWREIDGIKFYSITVAAYKGESAVKYEPCLCGVRLSFQERLKRLGVELKREGVAILQVNVGGLCNQSCLHCHVSGNPKDERVMTEETMAKVLSLLKRSKVEVLDITGGAPELNPHIEQFLSKAKAMVQKVIFRSNLTALQNRKGLIPLLKDKKVLLYASLPSLDERETDLQRGRGVFKASLNMLKLLNEEGFGTDYELILVYNPVKAELLNECSLADYKRRASYELNIRFTDVIAITNAPIGNFAKFLEKNALLEDYKTVLNNSFNSGTLEGVMCRRLLNIGYDGSIYDCDFNNALGLSIGHIDSIDNLDDFLGKGIIVGDHCYACTAKKGSSCFGSVCC